MDSYGHEEVSCPGAKEMVAGCLRKRTEGEDERYGRLH